MLGLKIQENDYQTNTTDCVYVLMCSKITDSSQLTPLTKKINGVKYIIWSCVKIVAQTFLEIFSTWPLKIRFPRDWPLRSQSFEPNDSLRGAGQGSLRTRDLTTTPPSERLSAAVRSEILPLRVCAAAPCTLRSLSISILRVTPTPFWSKRFTESWESFVLCSLRS